MRGERKGRVWSRNRYKLPMEKDNNVGIDYGDGGWVGQGRVIGGHKDNCNRITQN